jgi:hypothetical protein
MVGPSRLRCHFLTQPESDGEIGVTFTSSTFPLLSYTIPFVEDGGLHEHRQHREVVRRPLPWRFRLSSSFRRVDLDTPANRIGCIDCRRQLHITSTIPGHNSLNMARGG